MTWRKKLEAFSQRLTIRHRLIIAGLLIAAWLFCIVVCKDADVAFLLSAAIVVLIGSLTVGRTQRQKLR